MNIYKQAQLEKIRSIVRALAETSESDDLQLSKNLCALALVLSRQLCQEIEAELRQHQVVNIEAHGTVCRTGGADER